MKIICSMMSISGDQIACCHWLRGSATEKLTHVSQQAATNSNAGWRLRLIRPTKRPNRRSDKAFSRHHPAFHVFCSRFASQHVIQDADKVHRGEGRAIEPNGGHPMKTPGADKRHGLPQRRCHQRVHIGAIPVIEADHIRFFIHRQPIDANRRTAPKVGFLCRALTMPYSSSTSRTSNSGRAPAYAADR